MKGHSRLGGSGIHRIIGCPGSLALSDKLDKSPAGEAASTGTAAHKLGERCLREDVSPWDFEGETIEADGLQITVDAKICEGVELYVGYVWERMGESPTRVLEIEKEFHLKNLNEEMWGTADVVMSEPFGLLEIVDYKNGFHPVEVHMNPQLLFYALGAGEGEDFDRVRLTIVQPNALHQDGKIRSFELTWTELEAWRDNVLMPAVEMALKPGAPLATGAHCLFCDASGICPAQDKATTDLLEQHFDIISADAAPPLVESLSFDRLQEIHLAAPMIKKFLDACAVELQRQLEAGVHSEHFMLVAKKGNRAWIDEQFVLDSLEPTYGDLLYSKKLLTPAAMEFAFSKLFKEQGKKNPKKAAVEFLGHLWEKPDKGVVIAPRTSVRQEQGPSLIAEFMKDDPLFD